MSTIIYRNLKRSSGFTLVEVIVVAVIVAVLATVAIPLYSSYVENAKLNTAENCAGTLANFISAGIALGGFATETGAETYSENETIEVSTIESDTSKFTIPSGIRCGVDWTNGTVICTSGTQASKEYNFKK